MTTRQRRFKLLLDEMLPAREKFPQVNNYHDVKHIVHDLKKEGVFDEEIARHAKKLDRIIITKNIKHFRKLVEKYKVDVFGVSETLAPEKLDKQIMAILRKRSSRKMKGRFVKVTR